MTESAAKLARMAGQIAAFFHALPEDQAAAAIAGHINQFWAPPMRRDLLASFGAEAGQDEPAPLDPRVRQALPLIRRPAPRQS
jgi:formate dehydrogenase subunit delta